MKLQDITTYTQQSPNTRHRSFDCDTTSFNNIYNAFGATPEKYNEKQVWINYSLVIDGGEGVLWMDEIDSPTNRIYVGCELELDFKSRKWYVEIRYCNENKSDWKEIKTPLRKSHRSLTPSFVANTIIKDIADKDYMCISMI